jgi:cyclopropane fatty-acyl-phospholipid synthase-like methyltransferase
MLDKLRLVSKKDTILDYGCAVGFLMEGFRELGYKNVYGYDISDWAVAQAKNKGLNILNKVKKRAFDVIICLDVLEHMSDHEIHRVFAQYRSDIMIVRIPCSTDGKQFVLEVSNRDQTHINRKTKGDWTRLINDLGYGTVLPLNLLTIYDTPGVMCALCLKPGSQFLQ